MGVYISYQGKLNDTAQLDAALDAVCAFCHSVKWQTEEWSEHYSGVVLFGPDEAMGRRKYPKDDEPWPEETKDMPLRARVSSRHPPDLLEETLRGLVVKAPGAGDLLLPFSPSSGYLVTYMELPAFLVLNAIPETAHYSARYLGVDTSGFPETHIGICALLHMLKKQYVRDLRVSDPTGYWKKKDLKELLRVHKIDGALQQLARSPEMMRVFWKAAGIDVAKAELPEVESMHEVVSKVRRKKGTESKPKRVS